MRFMEVWRDAAKHAIKRRAAALVAGTRWCKHKTTHHGVGTVICSDCGEDLTGGYWS